jgi:hypothetical protein
MQNINYSGNQFIWKYLIILIVTCLAAWLWACPGLMDTRGRVR